MSFGVDPVVAVDASSYWFLGLPLLKTMLMCSVDPALYF
jgi:hypothetical protein